MIDTTRTIHSRLTSHRDLLDEMDVHIHRKHDWNEISLEDQEVMIGIAMECLTKDELLDLFINSDNLENAVIAIGCLMKSCKDNGDLRRAMRDCALEVMGKEVEEAYEFVQFDLLNDSMNEHGMYAYTSRETGELEWRKHA